MRRTDATAWVLTVCAVSLRLSQAKTLAALVAAAMGVQRISLANIGRRMLGSTQHQIKCCWRFCDNDRVDRVETADAMRGIVARLLKKRNKPLGVALDWVDIRGFQTLVASAVLKGRSTPICWASTTGHVYQGHKSRNAFEESLLLILRPMAPKSIQVARLKFKPSAWSSSSKDQGSVFQIGLLMLEKLKAKPPQALASVLHLSETIAGKWG